MSVSDILDFIQQIFGYALFRIDDTPVTVLTFALFLVVIGVALLVGRLARLALQRVLAKLPIDDETSTMLARVAQIVILLGGLLLAVRFLGVPLTGFSDALTYRLFELNNTPVTLSSVLTFILLVVVVIILARVLRRMLLSTLSSTQIDIGMQYVLARVTQYLVIVIGALMAFQFIGINLAGLAVIFGFLSVGVGFGLQNITSNFVSGLILLFERPIKVGDRVIVGDTQGDVTEINIRSTTIRTPDNISIIVPNSEFVSSRVTNWSHSDQKIRLDIPIGVSYGSDLDTVLRVLKEVALENPEILKNPQPDVLLVEFGDSSWNMLLRAWIDDPKRHPTVRSDLNCAIVRKFRANAIEIPFPQRDLHVRSPLPVPLATGNSSSI